MNIKDIGKTLIITGIILALGGCKELFDTQKKDPPAGNDHTSEQTELANDLIEFSEQAQKTAGLKTSRVKQGNIFIDKKFTGKTGFNEEKISKVIPRYSGYVRNVNKRLGESVRKGDVLAVIENKETFTEYKIISDVNGQIIERNINKGDLASEGEPVFIIADLSDLWVDIQVFSKDQEIVQAGRELIIEDISADKKAKAEVFYISPVSDNETGAVQVKALLINDDMSWKAGTYIKAGFLHKAASDVNVVRTGSIQFMDGHNILFVQQGQNLFKSVQITKGASNKMYTEIISGLDLNDEYVMKGGFELKSKAAVGSLGEHAGCGGAH